MIWLYYLEIIFRIGFLWTWICDVIFIKEGKIKKIIYCYRRKLKKGIDVHPKASTTSLNTEGYRGHFSNLKL